MRCYTGWAPRAEVVHSWSARADVDGGCGEGGRGGLAAMVFGLAARGEAGRHSVVGLAAVYDDLDRSSRAGEGGPRLGRLAPPPHRDGQ